MVVEIKGGWLDPEVATWPQLLVPGMEATDRLTGWRLLEGVAAIIVALGG